MHPRYSLVSLPVCFALLLPCCADLLLEDHSHSLMHDYCDIPSYDIHIRSFVGLSHTLVYRTLSRILLLTRPSSNVTSFCCSAACLNEPNLHYIVHLYPYALTIPSFFLFRLHRSKDAGGELASGTRSDDGGQDWDCSHGHTSTTSRDDGHENRTPSEGDEPRLGSLASVTLVGDGHSVNVLVSLRRA
ncbi:hypothetical protein C8F01DRAFT_1275434 [Mycena amicta]|nr:hypothetical protein C8F01DRAFT_1275434 [Mycena amicta]